MKNFDLIQLEQLLMKLGDGRIITGTEEDGEYEGKLQILVGDDTLIREKDGKFYVFDFHEEDADPIWMDEKGVLDFYAGKKVAYNFPNSTYDSYHHLRGFRQVARNLIDGIEVFLDDNDK